MPLYKRHRVIESVLNGVHNKPKAEVHLVLKKKKKIICHASSVGHLLAWSGCRVLYQINLRKCAFVGFYYKQTIYISLVRSTVGCDCYCHVLQYATHACYKVHYLYCCTVHLVDSLNIALPTNALIVCHLF